MRGIEKPTYKKTDIDRGRKQTPTVVETFRRTENRTGLSREKITKIAEAVTATFTNQPNFGFLTMQ